MVRRRSMSKRKPIKRAAPKSKYVVTAKFTMKSKPVTARQKAAMVNKVRKSGGTATVRKV